MADENPANRGSIAPTSSARPGAGRAKRLWYVHGRPLRLRHHTRGGYTPGVRNRGRSAGRGWFVTIEGPEGAGKTSQADRLASAIGAAGIAVTLTREPGGTAAGELIRTMLLGSDPGGVPLNPRTDALLFSAARAQLVADVIEPALARGDAVICTRFADSTLAYQGYGGGLPVDELRVLERFATGGLAPDLTILLDLPVEAGLARKVGGEVTRFESAFDLPFHRRVRDGFLALAAQEPDRFVIVDAAPDPETVFWDVFTAIQRLPDLAARLGAHSSAPAGGGDPGGGRDAGRDAGQAGRQAPGGERAQDPGQPNEPERP